MALLVVVGLGLCFVAQGVAADEAAAPDPEAINRLVHSQLEAGDRMDGPVHRVSGQLYIPRQHIEAATIREALAAVLEAQQGEARAVAVQRPPRLNFEIHFKKNSAELTEESHASLDELAEVLASEYRDMRFVLGGHTDQDGDDVVNQPLSQARAEAARRYLLERHAIDADRLVARGFGADEPLREVEQSAQDKLYNRRVDLRPIF